MPAGGVASVCWAPVLRTPWRVFTRFVVAPSTVRFPVLQMRKMGHLKVGQLAPNPAANMWDPGFIPGSLLPQSGHLTGTPLSYL